VYSLSYEIIPATINVIDAVAKITCGSCKPYKTPKNFGQIKYTIGCVPMTAMSLVDFHCSAALSRIPIMADCPFMIKDG
jgi:hypothetical protein